MTTLLAYDPTAQELGHWAQALFWLVGTAATAVGLLVGVKKLREKPAPNPTPVAVGSPVLVEGVKELATTRFVEERVARVDADSRQRASENKDRIVSLERKMDQRHQENVGSLREIHAKLDRNFSHFEEIVARRDDAADSRRDALRTLISTEVKGVHDRVNEIVQGFGELRGEMRHVAKAADDSSKAANVAAAAARGAIEAAHAARNPAPAPVAPPIRA